MIFVLPVLLECVTLASGMRGPHHPRGHYHYVPKADHQKLTQDTQLLQDVEHIKEDLNNVLSEEQARKMTPEELEFHYFKLHDFDNNTKLDGLEILQAIHHSTHHEGEDDHGGGSSQSSHGADIKGRVTQPPQESQHSTSEDFQYFVELIDQVLAEDDLDNDGYLSYIEYVVGRQKDQNKRNTQPKKEH